MDNTAAGAVNFSRLCRVCLMEFKEMYSLFSFIQFDDNLKKPVYLYEMIMSVSSMKISAEDHLPAKVCANCKQLAHTSYKFQQQCNRSQEILDSYLPNKNVMTEEKPLNLDSEESTKCNVFQTIDSYLSDKHYTIEEKPLHLDNEEKLQDETQEDNMFIDNAFVKIEVDDSTDTPEIVPVDDDASQQQSLSADQLEERNFDNSSDIYCEEQNLEKAARTTENLLPQKSKGAYEQQYCKFQQWMTRNCVEVINETILLEYFKELSRTFTPNSLWAKFSMLKKTILLNKNTNIGKYPKLVGYLKQKSKGYQPKKSKVLTREEVLKFIHEAPNQTFLMIKVALLFGIFGGCRREELVNMLVDYIEDRGEVIVVTIPETTTNKKRIFTIIDEETMGSLKLIREYGALRPQGCTLRRYFLNYRNGRCCSQAVGKNMFGKIPSTVAKYLGLKDADKYTGQCLRMTSATLLAGASMITLKRHGGWRCSSVAEGYLEDSMKNKVAKLLVGESSTSTTTPGTGYWNIS